MQVAKKRSVVLAIEVQIALTVLISIGLFIVDNVYSYSSLAGGVIATIANAYFARRVFTDYRAQNPDKLVAQIYVAEISKLILVGVLFGVTFVVIDPLSAGALFSVFMIVHLTPLLMALTGR